MSYIFTKVKTFALLLGLHKASPKLQKSQSQDMSQDIFISNHVQILSVTLPYISSHVQPMPASPAISTYFDHSIISSLLHVHVCIRSYIYNHKHIYIYYNIYNTYIPFL